MSRTIPMICAVLLLATAAAPAFAQNVEHVPVGDLDLYNQKDSAEALHRVEDAAGRVCAPALPPMGRERREAARCEVQSVEDAVERTDHPGLTAQYEGNFPTVIISEGDADYYAVPDKKG